MKYIAMLVAILGLTAAIVSSLMRSVQAQATASVAVDLDPSSTTGISIEGLVSDSTGRLYTADTASRRLFRYTPSSNNLETLGTLPRSATGMAFDVEGNLFMASGDTVLRINKSVLAGSAITTTDVITFATGVTGANGLAFDIAGRLFVSGGATGNIYILASDGMTSTFASGLTSERTEQKISTNGLAFWTDGTLYSSNTGTGSIDKITLNADGTLKQVQQWVKDPLLLGADGITFAANGDLYAAANERNAIVRITPQGQVSDVSSNDNNGPLEFPASPAFSGKALYASNFDIARGANSPNTPGVGGSLARITVGVEGLPLPVVFAPPVVASPSAEASPSAQESPSAVASVAPSTPVSSPEVATPTTGTTAPQATATTAPVEPTATVIPPGIPQTGGEQWPLFMALGLFICSVAIVAGFVLRNTRRA